MKVHSMVSILAAFTTCCATVVAEPDDAQRAPEAAVALGRLLAPLATPSTARDLVGSEPWPGAQMRKNGGVVQVDFGPAAQTRCGFRGRFSLTQQADASWLVSIDELSDKGLRYWGTAEVHPDATGMMLRLDLVVLEGARGAELIVSGRIRRVAGRWRLEAEGVWNNGMTEVPVRVAQALVVPAGARRAPNRAMLTDSSFL
ncbi:MAG: hypothetical protein AAFN74_19065 [Myxococcota bacterium]